jgi:molecular chaperone GrpE
MTEKKQTKKKPAKEKTEEAKKAAAEEKAEEATEAAAAEESVEEEEPLQMRFLRLQADFDNFRKRMVRDRAEWILRANEELFLEMLPVLDHYEMGLRSAEEHQTDCSVTEGFRLVYNQLIELLKKFNAEPIEAIGEPFDPHRHEAVTHMPSDQPAETVVAEVRRGYMLNNKLLRASQVVVSSGPAEENEVSE